MGKKKETSDKMASLASRVLRTGEATASERKALAACVLAQDETKGKRQNKSKPKGKTQR